MSKNFTVSFVPRAIQRPEFVDAPAVIANNVYVSLPPWHAVQRNLTVALNSTIPTGVFNFVDIVAMRSWHNVNASTIYSTFIPSTYFYVFDGTTSTSILDGGNNFDMFDTGNFLSISTTRTTTNILSVTNDVYGAISTMSNQNFGYFITSRNVWPQVSMAYIQNGSILWRASGGIGSDNQGTLSNVSSTYTTNRGYTGRFWANQGFNQGNDPSICYTWFTIESTSWNTLISSSNNGLAVGAVPPDPMNQFMRITGCNYMFGMFLLSCRRPPLTPVGVGFFLSTTILQSFLSNYVENANIVVT